MPAIGNARVTRHRYGKLKTGRPKGGAALLSDGKPRTYEHGAGRNRIYVKAGVAYHPNLALDRKVRAKPSSRTRKEPHWRGDTGTTSRI